MNSAVKLLHYEYEIIEGSTELAKRCRGLLDGDLNKYASVVRQMLFFSSATRINTITIRKRRFYFLR